MKKINKYLLLMVGAIVTMLFGSQSVFASTLSFDHTGYWYELSDGGDYYMSWKLENYYVDGNVAYCIEPGIPEGTDNYREASWEVTGLPNWVKDRVSLIAYYGYSYDNHQTTNYRLAAQGMIWETILGGNIKTYFNTARYGAGTPQDVSYEKSVIEDLVAHHFDKPSFNGGTYSAQVGTPIVITDTNNVLSNYEVRATNGAEVSVDGNTITITPTQIGSVSISFVKKLRYERNYIVYIADGYQNMISTGNVDPVTASINVTGIGGKVELEKVDSKTLNSNAQGEATLEGAVYGIYDESDNLIQTLTTDSNGHAISDNLPYFGKYYAKEISASRGYQLSDEKFYFESSKDEMLSHVKVLEKVITRKYEFTKVIASDKTGIMTPEVNVEFGVYNSKNELYMKATTDNEGKIYLTLPYGSYTLKQLTSTKDHEKIEDFKFEVKEVGDTVNKVFANADITAKLKVIKIDAYTGKVIKRSNIKFKIYNVDKKEYVCQTITYPTAQTICEYSTDDNGVLITPYALSSGTYKLEEVDQAIDGYIWNKESVEFHIGENDELITDSEYGILFETNFKNKQVKGSIELTKIGEKVVIKDDGYQYEEIKLSGVAYELYASKDIISGDGSKIYSKDELVGTYKTNDKGYLKINNLYLGSYYLIEKSTDSNHVLDTTKHYFTLKYKDQYTPVVTQKITLKNYLKKSNVEISKVDISTSEPLPNTKIQVFDSSNDKLIFVGVTNEFGKIVITDLYVGKFYFKEIEAPVGYKLNDEKMTFEIKDNGKVIKSTIKDEKITGTLEFSKVDFSTSEPLPNTLIEIYNDKNELVFSGRTNEDGKIIIEELEYGKYYILEKEAPNGYELNPNKMNFEITEDGQVVKCTMTDEKIVEVPNTSLSDSKVLDIVGFALIVAGVGYIIYDKKKNNK